jgi:hypothetical protein
MPRWPRLAGVAARVLTFVPPLLVVSAVARHARNVPWKDQWGVVPFMADASRGTLRWSALWDQVNEHRIPVAMALQGLLAWWTRWDVRYEAWADVVIAGATLVLLAGLVRRTFVREAPAAAPWMVVACSVITFSLAGGINWIWGSMAPAYLSALAAAGLAWGLAGWRGTWMQTGGLVLWAIAGALSFGAGVCLVVLLPAALALTPTAPRAVRARHARASGAAAAILLVAYFVGWHPRVGEPPPTMHWDRLGEYVRYVLAYLGAGLGSSVLDVAFASGVALAVVFVVASAVVLRRGTDTRAASMPWLVLAAYTAVNGVLTAYGRLDNGLFTAAFVRYRPTAAYFPLATLALATLATAAAWHRSRVAGGVATVVLAFSISAAVPVIVTGSEVGADVMARLTIQLDVGATCLPQCATAPDMCLLYLCWSADVARQMCPIMSAARIGPFAR